MIRGKNFLPFSLALMCCLFLSWYPYVPKTSLKEKEIKGPAKLLVENVSHWQYRNIVVQEFSRSGLLKEIRYYEPKFTEPDTGLFSVQLPINADYAGVDTMEFNFSYKVVYKYSRSLKLIFKSGIDSEGKAWYENVLTYNDVDSLIKSVSTHFNADGNLDEVFETNYSYTITDSSSTCNMVLGEDHSWWIFFFDNDKRVVRKQSHYASNAFRVYQTDYEYDKRGNQTKIGHSLIDSIFDEELRLTSMKIIDFNSNLNIVSETELKYSDWKTTRFHSLYKYVKGKKIQSLKTDIEYRDTDTTSSTLAETFNKQGDITGYSIFEYEDTTNFQIDYVYDEYENWTSRKHYKGTKLTDESERIIVYYPME